jgi:hypothetical protein
VRGAVIAASGSSSQAAGVGFVKRVLDRRTAVFLARRGAGVAQTAAAEPTHSGPGPTRLTDIGSRRCARAVTMTRCTARLIAR